MTDELRRRQADENFAELSARIDAEVAVGWSLKASIESRALGLFALNLGVVTLYLALSESLQIAFPASDSFLYWVNWGAFIAAAVSLALGILATWPANYSAVSTAMLGASFSHAKDADTRLLPDLLPLRIKALRRLRTVNTAKARWVVWGMVAAAVSVACFVAVILNSVVTAAIAAP